MAANPARMWSREREQMLAEMGRVKVDHAKWRCGSHGDNLWPSEKAGPGHFHREHTCAIAELLK